MLSKEDLFKKYVNKDISRKELEILFDYLKNDGEDQYEGVLDEIWQTLHEVSLIDETTKQSVFFKVSDKITEKEIKEKQKLYWRYMRIAASVLLVVGFSYLLFRAYQQSNIITLQNGYAQSKQITLPDSSIVTLNANSKLSYKKSWSNNKKREIWLEGEAFFTVTHKENLQKFVVHANNLDVVVVGTSFNVNSREDKTQVVLSSGKVKLESKDKKQYEMNPGEMIEIEKGGESTKKIVNPNIYTSWRNDELIFRATPLREISRILKNNYGIEMEFEDAELASKEFTGSSSTSEEGIKDLLFTLSKAYNVKLIEDGKNKIVVQSKK